jgi:hypothetical protein
MMKSAVLFVVFNRPDTTARVFETIRAAKPPRLYVAADGPRIGRDGEAALCSQVRKLATQVDWPCKLYTLFQDTNLGCKIGVSSAINWFFEHEEEGIVLEDDILAQPSFFEYCDEMLDRYRDDTKVSMVSGCNLLSKRLPMQESYFFSRYVYIWGWATWRRAWKHYDVTMAQWPSWRTSGALHQILGFDNALTLYWEKIFNQVHSNEIDTWDYQWVFTCWKESGLDIVPVHNLIENLGFGPDATHTIMETPQLLLESLPSDLDFPLRHPNAVERNHVADQYFERLIFNIQPITSIQLENPMPLPSIENLHRNKIGKVSDKWASYLPYYDQLFAPLREFPVKLLEIGVQNGGSLETWSNYFNNATLLIGCDIDENCAELRYSDARINIVVGDANSGATYQKILDVSPQFDIVIDDGSHRSTDIINSFINYFPLLTPGGVYVVEDTCCLFMDEFGGGVLSEFSAYAFFKRLTDVVNFQFWKNEVSINNYLRTFFDLRSTPIFILDGWLESIEFRNSIITIKKALKPGHEKLGERIIVGSDALVQNWGGKLPS